MASFGAIGVEDGSARHWLKVVISIPVGLRASGKDGEVIRTGGIGVDGSCPDFSFVTMADTVVVGQMGH
jgi:hypothetical protein